MVLVSESSPVAVRATLSTVGLHDASCTKRMLRLPPVSAALRLNTSFTWAAHVRNDPSMVLYLSVTPAAWAYMSCTRGPLTPSPWHGGVASATAASEAWTGTGWAFRTSTPAGAGS